MNKTESEFCIDGAELPAGERQNARAGDRAQLLQGLSTTQLGVRPQCFHHSDSVQNSQRQGQQ